jgi:hypothetical protein
MYCIERTELTGTHGLPGVVVCPLSILAAPLNTRRHRLDRGLLREPAYHLLVGSSSFLLVDDSFGASDRDCVRAGVHMLDGVHGAQGALPSK